MKVEQKLQNRIKLILTQKGMTQSWLARKLGVDFKTINAYANNHYQPRLVILAEIATLLNIDIRELLE